MAAVFIASFTEIAFASLKGSSCESEAALLTALGILPDGAISSMSEGTGVTRQDFAEYVEKALGETDESVSGYTEKFSDFTATGYVAKGVFDGFITGYPDGSFKPAKMITAAESYKMIIDATGYKAMLRGDYPDSYVALAAEKGINKNVTKGADKEIDTKDAVFLIYNMLMLEAPQISADGKGLTLEKDKTILSEKFDVKKSVGIISANEYTSLTSPKGASKGCVDIDGIEYEAGISGAENYLGYNVEYYYRDDRGDYTIVYVNPKKKSSDMRIYADEIESFENGTYYYYDSQNASRTSKASVSLTADVIYNGKAMTDISDNSIYTPEFGSVTLIDNNRDGKYEVVSIIDRNVMVLNMYDDGKHIFYDKYDSANTVEIDPEDGANILKIKNSLGADVALKDIAEWDVLEIAQSADGEITDIIVHRESVTGTITSIGENDDGKPIIAIDSSEYEISQKLKKYNEQKGTPFQIQQSYTFIISSDGIVVGYNSNAVVASDGSYGYMISVKKDDTEEDFFYIKMFCADNQMRTLKTSKKPRIDGVSSKNAMEAYDKMPLNPMLVYYKTDDAGAVKEIDTIDKTDKESVNTLMVKGRVNNEKYSGPKKTIGGRISFNDASIAFIVPDNPLTAPEKDFGVKPATEYFRHFNSYSNIVGYARDKVSPFTEATVVVDSTAAKIKSSDPIWLVQSIASGINEDGEEVTVLTLINSSGTKEYNTESMEIADNAKAVSGSITTGVKKGDVIMMATNKLGEINCIQVIYRPETDKFYYNNNPNYPGDFLSANRIGLWDVFYKGEKFLRVVPTGTAFDDENVENVELANVFVYEKDEKTPYRSGTVGEVKDYYSTGMASKVLSRTYEAATQILIIYN